VQILLLTGSNLGNRVNNLDQAYDKLSKIAISNTRRSDYYESEPWGEVSQGNYLNQGILGETDLHPKDLLSCCLNIEKQMGRVRKEPNGPRIIDIDILLYGDKVVNQPDLTIPHPQFSARRFALTTTAEIAGKWTHPTLQVSIAELLHRCTDNLKVWKKIVNPPKG
jgi:2-amino-4-hydroxy-6-hydroxymethyldihydropteridine diphosphokinase